MAQTAPQKIGDFGGLTLEHFPTTRTLGDMTGFLFAKIAGFFRGTPKKITLTWLFVHYFTPIPYSRAYSESSSRSWLRARWSLDITVPRGMPNICDISL